MKKIKKLDSEKIIGFIMEEDSRSTIFSVQKETTELIIDRMDDDGDSQTIIIEFDDLLEILIMIDNQMMEETLNENN